MSRRSWVASSLVSRPEIFCWVLVGRTPRSLILFVGHTVVSRVKRSTSCSRSRQNSSRSSAGGGAAGVLGGGVLRSGDAGDGGQADGAGAAELGDQRRGRVFGDGWQVVVAGVVPGVDEAAQRPLRLGGPVRVRVGLGGVLETPAGGSQAGLGH